MEQGKVTAKSVLIALIGVLLVGVGVAFNNCAGLGNDPVGIVYDGIRNVTGMGAEQLGLASNIVNLSLALLVFFTGRKYISVGTLVYFLPYGFFVELGILLYQFLAPETGGLAAILMAFNSPSSVLFPFLNGSDGYGPWRGGGREPSGRWPSPFSCGTHGPWSDEASWADRYVW